LAGVHEDFGEKIGGAKKDLWKDRGLYADDLEAMNEREAEKFVKKDNVWKKPDYAAMLEEGIPLGVVYFIKKARDGLNAPPLSLRPLRSCHEYRKFLRQGSSCRMGQRTGRLDLCFQRRCPKGI
jgi:hypothetical protein